VDWIEFKRERLSAFVATLGYSRWRLRTLRD
jgi:hypothetical protein